MKIKEGGGGGECLGGNGIPHQNEKKKRQGNNVTTITFYEVNIC